MAFCWRVKPSTVVSSLFFFLSILATSWSKATLVLSSVLALVSRQTMPISDAILAARSLSTCRIYSKSFLLPTSSRSMRPTSVLSLTSLIQKFTISKDFRLLMSNTSRIPSTFRQQLGVTVLYLAVPAVSQIWTRTVQPSSSLRVFCLYSTPMVVVWLALNSSSTYCVSSELFPTQLSPIISSFTRTSSLPPLIDYIKLLPSPAPPLPRSEMATFGGGEARRGRAWVGNLGAGWRLKCGAICRRITIRMSTEEKPKKPLTFYFKFRNERMKELEGKSNRAEIIKKDWDNLAQEEKDEGNDCFKKEMEKWKKEVEKWKGGQTEEEDAKKAQRSKSKRGKGKEDENDEAVKPPKVEKGKGAPPKGKPKEEEKEEKPKDKGKEKEKEKEKEKGKGKEDKEDEDQNKKKDPSKGKKATKK